MQDDRTAVPSALCYQRLLRGSVSAIHPRTRDETSATKVKDRIRSIMAYEIGMTVSLPAEMREYTLYAVPTIG